MPLLLSSAAAPQMRDAPLRIEHRYGFSDAMRRCNVPIADSASSMLGLLQESLHHSKNTVLLDQGLLLFPLVLLGGYQMMGLHSSLAVVGASMYCVLLCVRLRYTGLLP